MVEQQVPRVHEVVDPHRLPLPAAEGLLQVLTLVYLISMNFSSSHVDNFLDVTSESHFCQRHKQRYAKTFVVSASARYL